MEKQRLTVKITMSENREVFCEGIKCQITPQATKGENKEVAILEPIVGKKWQRHVSLSRLSVGEQEIALKPRDETSHTQKKQKKVVYTEAEAAELAKLRARIAEIEEIASNRIPKFDRLLSQSEVANLSKEDKLEYQTWLENYIESLKA